MLRLVPYWLIVPAAAAAVAVAVLVNPPSGDAADGSAMIIEPEMDARAQELDVRRHDVLDRIAYKDRLVGQLVAGRATLEEVTAEFLRLNQGNPAALAAIRRQFSGSTDEERTARNVLAYVRIRAMPADQKAKVLARLQRELQRRYGGATDAAQ